MQTHALLSGSPAIDAGDNSVCPATDARGTPRSDGQCDAGAYEAPAAPPSQEVVDPPDLATLADGTDVLLTFDDFPDPANGQPLPAGYAGCTWIDLVEGAPWAEVSTWNFYIADDGPHGSILFPRPVVVTSLRVSAATSNTFTLSSPGNPEVSVTASDSQPQTLLTGWTTPVLTLTVHAGIDQVFDDLRLTTRAYEASTPGGPWLQPLARGAGKATLSLPKRAPHRPALIEGTALLITRTYYVFGTMRVAMRVQGEPEPAQNGLFYLHGDHPHQGMELAVSACYISYGANQRRHRRHNR